MDSSINISVLIPTKDRSAILRETLRLMAAAKRNGLNVEYIVLDNNSSDDTANTAKDFAASMPLKYFYLPKAGKSKALNFALNELDLGEIIVFADDDIVVQDNWLLRINEVCRRRCDYSVFGGKLELIWPQIETPAWTSINSIQFWAFGEHDMGNEEIPYRGANFPSGPLYWVRRSIIEKHNLRFNENVGPEFRSPMGDETTFLCKLRDSGYRSLYVPSVCAGHRVHPYMFVLSNMLLRAKRWGAGQPHSLLCRRSLFKKHPNVWRSLRLASLLRHYLFYHLAKLSPASNRQVELLLNSATGIGYDTESLRLSYLRAD